MKVCPKCDRELPETEFNKVKTRKDGPCWWCRTCVAINNAKRRTNGINATYHDYDRLLTEQFGRCAICGTDKPCKDARITRFCIDHNHQTSKLRGLLCNDCNRALGLFGDNIHNLRKAVSYMEATE